MKKLLILCMALSVSCSMKAAILIVPEHYPTIQQGIDAAGDTDTVLIMPGHYFENLLVISKNISIGSMFIINGDTSHISQTIMDGNQAGHVIRFEDITIGTELVGLTLTNGRSTLGGGIFIQNSNILAKHIRVIDNISACGNYVSAGGGIYCANSDLELRDFILTGNMAYCMTPPINPTGGGLRGHSSSVSLVDGIISQNEAFLGGGLYLTDSEVNISDVIFTLNDAPNPGSAVCVFRGEMLLTNSIFKNNTGFGGTIYADAIPPGKTLISIINCLFSENYEPINFMGKGKLKVNSSTFAGNYGGHSILIYNTGELSMINSIFWNDYTTEIVLNPTTSALIGYINLQGGLSAIASSGSVVLTGPIYDFDPLFLSDTNFMLSVYSPCIGAGIDSLPVFPFMVAPAFDIINGPRPDPSGSMPDLGAYENPLSSQLVGISAIVTDGHTEMVRIFPNPARSFFSLKNESGETIHSIDFYNHDGRILFSIRDLSLPDQEMLSINTKWFSSSGLVVIKCGTKDRILFSRMVIL